MFVTLLLAGAFAADEGVDVRHGPVTVPPERVATVARVQAAAAAAAGIPYGAVEWRQPHDPADHAPYAFDFSALLDEGEKIADILSLRLSSAAAALGITVDTTAQYSPMIDEGAGVLAQVWFLVSEPQQDNASFSAAGVKMPVTMQIETDANPPKVYERTAVLPVRQL
jgi:hypothetical protein